MSASCSGMLTLSADCSKVWLQLEDIKHAAERIGRGFCTQEKCKETTECQRQYSCLLSLGMLQKRHRGRCVNEG